MINTIFLINDVIEIGVMRHLLQVFSDDPTMLRGFILD